MMRPSRVFHALSYLQYPLLVVALIYMVQVQRGADAETMLTEINNVMVFIGLALSFSTLQDTTTTQNEVSRKIWSNPLAGKTFLLLLALTTTGLIAAGLWGMYQASDHRVHQLSLGFVVLGIGTLGLLKAAGEMFEHHRPDR